jgi:hypothetical protein
MFRGCSLFGAAIAVAALIWSVPVVCEAGTISPGNVVVFRAGSGANLLVNTGNDVFLDEYTKAGSLVQSIAINSTGTGTKLVVAGNSTAEGGLTISPDGKWIGFAGYNSSTGAASSLSQSSSLSVPRVAGVLNTTTGNYTLTLTGTMFSGNSPRSALSTDGNKIFASGGGNGLVYGTADGSTTFRSISGTNTATNLRWLGAYGTSSSGTSLFVSAASGTWPTVGMFGGNPLVTGTATSLTAQPDIPNSGGTPVTNRYGFVYLDTNPSIPGLDTLYVADDGLQDGGITKYLLAASGTWNRSGQLSGSRVNPTSNFRGLTGSFDGTDVTLFGTVLSSGSSGGGTSRLFSYLDANAATSTLTGTTSSLTTLATSGSNQVFRGVVMVPDVMVVPEPSAILLLGSGACGAVALWRGRNRRQTSP